MTILLGQMREHTNSSSRRARNIVSGATTKLKLRATFERRVSSFPKPLVTPIDRLTNIQHAKIHVRNEPTLRKIAIAKGSPGRKKL